MIGNGCADSDDEHDDIDGPHHGFPWSMILSENRAPLFGIMLYSRDRPNHGRRRMPIVQPASAAANQIQPCSEPEATPPTNAPMLQPKPSRAPQPISRPPIAAAASDRAGGQSVRANGREAAAAAMAPRIIPKSVRLDVSVRTDSANARFGPGHCQNSCAVRSMPVS